MTGGTVPLRLAVLGAGAIGQRHAEVIAHDPDVTLAGLADPSPAGGALADRLGTVCYPDLDAMIAGARPDGVIVATPNALHVDNALTCIAAGLAVLVEKPLAVDTASARQLIAAAEQAGVPLLVGHHRRHSARVAAAREAIVQGLIGRPVMVNAQCWLMKPESYFAPEWRRRAGAGPVLTNMIHDIDLLRHFCGDVISVQAVSSNAQRGYEVEDSAAVLLRFDSGALATMSVSDSAVAPWSWELTSTENPDYPATGQFCYLVAGTEGALEIPTLRLWRNPGATGWFEPLEPHSLPADANDPLVAQIRHFAAVIREDVAPLVSGADGLAALAVLEAVSTAARTGGTEFLNQTPRV